MSDFDALDKRKLAETHTKVELLIEQLARLQERQEKFIKSKQQNFTWGRKYLRKIIREQRETIAQQKLYIRQLENELRLRGLE
jgi:hypothetical protein